MKRYFIISCLVLLFSFGLSCFAFGADQVAHLSWNQILSEDFDGWYVYVSEINGDRTGITPIRIEFVSELATYTTPLTIDSPNGEVKTWYITVTAFDTSGNESGEADWISLNIDFESPPIPIELLIEIRRT